MSTQDDLKEVGGQTDKRDGNYVGKNIYDLANVPDLCLCVSESTIIWNILRHTNTPQNMRTSNEFHGVEATIDYVYCPMRRINHCSEV